MWSSPTVRLYFDGHRDTPLILDLDPNRAIVDASTAAIIAADLDIDYSVFNTLLDNRLNNIDFNEIIALDGTVYKDGNTYKKLVLTTVNNNLSSTFKPSQLTHPNITSEIISAFEKAGFNIHLTPAAQGSPMTFPTTLYYSSYLITFVEVGAPITEAKITFKSSIKPLLDAPYKMFCIPVEDGSVLEVNSQRMPMDKERSVHLASSLGMGLKTGADGFLYDLQLLPYCPIPNEFEFLRDRNGLKYIGGGTEHIDYDLMYDNETPIGCLFYCSQSSFSTRTTSIGTIYLPGVLGSDVDFKVKNECYKFRIVAPNYANYEDFNYFMNYGFDSYDIDCTYKPLTPYIKLNINYKGLYGQDWNDQRGLILGGDYSLPVMNSSWVNYQIQNKNYSNIFDRETQHLQHEKGWNTASAITGAIGGTVIGSVMGGAMGGTAGAIAGGIGAGIAGTTDVLHTIFGQQEAMDYRKDLFQMNLQNIQALPQGLIKTSAFNENSRIWPFLEIYRCTPEEEECVRNKIKYTGMTIGAIGKVSDYLNPEGETWIQGRIIRIEGLEDDTHVASAINKELNMGVFM